MNHLRFLLLTTLILVSTSRLPAQPPPLDQGARFSTPAVCNDGTFTIWVARAHRAPVELFGGGEWRIWGWFDVDPGKCSEIGPETRFIGGGWFGNGDSLTLLAFAYFDSKKVLRGVKVQGEEGWFYRMYPADQQICVGREQFDYTWNSDQSTLARKCNGSPAGYMLIPASFMFKGSSRITPLFGDPDNSPDYVHVTITADGHGITSGHPWGSAGISQGVGGGGTPHGDDGGSSLCGKVSCADIIMQKLKEAAAQQAAANANSNPPAPRASANPPPPTRSSTNPPPPSSRAAAPPPPVDDDDPIGGGGGVITAPSHSAPVSSPANSLQWVRTEIPAYIQASQNGFAAYKKGNGQLSQGLRMWDSSVRPSAARGCWVVQGNDSTTLSCALSPPGDLNERRSYYAELNKEIAAALPRDWTTQVEQPFGGDLPSHGYRSSSGAHLEVFIRPAESGSLYEVHFQLLSAH